MNDLVPVGKCGQTCWFQYCKPRVAVLTGRHQQAKKLHLADVRCINSNGKDNNNVLLTIIDFRPTQA